MASGALSFAFDAKNEAAQAAVDQYVRRYTWRVSQSTRKAINGIVERAIRDGIPPREAARLIRDTIGLDAPRAQAVANYRAELSKSGLSASSVEARTAEYARQSLNRRALTVSRTETMGALNAGIAESWKEARGAGLLSLRAVKEWMVAFDETTCQECANMDGEQVPIDAAFSSGDLEPPLHPNCRCTVSVLDLLPSEMR